MWQLELVTVKEAIVDPQEDLSDLLVVALIIVLITFRNATQDFCFACGSRNREFFSITID